MVTVREDPWKSAHRAWTLPRQLWREATAARRLLPDFVIIGAQRAGTTSLYWWLADHTAVEPAIRKEVHYFDINYSRGERWYKANFPMSAPGTITGEATPYLLFHPLAAERAARDLDSSARFIALLREPVERAVSHYWHERRGGFESEPFDRAVDLEAERLQGGEDVIRRGERSFSHQHHSYLARGCYADQLRRWFSAVGRERVLVIESEKMFSDPTVVSDISAWLGLGPSHVPMPSLNAAGREEVLPAGLAERLQRHFEPYNDDLFELLGTKLWSA